MTFDHISLTIGIASLVFLFGLLYLVKFTKDALRNRNRNAYEKVHQFGKKLDKINIILFTISGSCNGLGAEKLASDPLFSLYRRQLQGIHLTNYRVPLRFPG